MRSLAFTLVLGLLSPVFLSAQVNYLERPDLLSKVEQCLHFTYNFSFKEARSIQEELAGTTPQHPAPLFLDALIVYWENFPLLPENQATSRFEDLMDRTVELAKELQEHEKSYLEGVFFDLFGRAFKAMFWADNGRAGKLIPDLAPMYRQTKAGFELKEQFEEFYFSTGLYNYYIEAYPEAHPVYKPFLAFMQKGDKKMGLQQLNHAIQHSIYLKVESILFMSLIQLKYEKDLPTASLYAERLHREYPNNIYYQGHLVTVMLYLERFNRAKEVISSMNHQHDGYSEMIRSMASAIIAEKQDSNSRRATTDYKSTIEYAGNFGPFADQFAAIGYMGLSRLELRSGEERKSAEYARKAARLTSYPFILEN
jgi:hypothetical protein